MLQVIKDLDKVFQEYSKLTKDIHTCKQVLKTQTFNDIQCILAITDDDVKKHFSSYDNFIKENNLIGSQKTTSGYVKQLQQRLKAEPLYKQINGSGRRRLLSPDAIRDTL